MDRTLRLSLLLALPGCGGAPVAPASGPTASAPVSSAVRVAAAPEVPAAVAFESGSSTCQLRALAGKVVATCASGPLTCTEVARADVLAPEGDEVVARCDDQEESPSPWALVVARGDAVLWVQDLASTVGPDSQDCDLPPAVTISAVEAVPGEQKALLVRQIGCASPGLLGDADTLFQFFDGQASPVAAAQVRCQWTGDTASPDAAPPPPDEAYSCDGAYLQVEREGAGWVVQQVAPAFDGYVGETRDALGRLGGGELTTTTLRWDAAARAFTPPAP
ncbi:MAG: hypothetical protein R3F60_17075 [bacterium]